MGAKPCFKDIDNKRTGQNADCFTAQLTQLGTHTNRQSEKPNQASRISSNVFQLPQQNSKLGDRRSESISEQIGRILPFPTLTQPTITT